jgi:glycosyltransferase involved in cell wall biosynthesis
MAARAIFRSMRRWDRRSARHIDLFIANSENVRGRIARYYGRDALVIPPPIDCQRFQIGSSVSDYFLVVSRLVPYKRVDIAVQAFNELGWPLHIVGSGVELSRLRAVARPNIKFLGQLDDAALAREYAAARALMFTANEDAGMVPLEVMASGRPVLAYREGGAAEVVVSGKTGELFDRQEPTALIAALKAFRPETYNPAVLRAHAEQYDRSRFRASMQRVVAEVMKSPTDHVRHRH